MWMTRPGGVALVAVAIIAMACSGGDVPGAQSGAEPDSTATAAPTASAAPTAVANPAPIADAIPSPTATPFTPPPTVYTPPVSSQSPGTPTPVSPTPTPTPTPTPAPSPARLNASNGVRDCKTLGLSGPWLSIGSTTLASLPTLSASTRSQRTCRSAHT